MSPNPNPRSCDDAWLGRREDGGKFGRIEIGEGVSAVAQLVCDEEDSEAVELLIPESDSAKVRKASIACAVL